MAKKVLLPVFPSERFYDAVVAAADLVAQEGGLIVFCFTRVRRPPSEDDRNEPGGQALFDYTYDQPEEEPGEQESARQGQIAALEDARALLRERGIGEAQIDYVFADNDVPPAESIAAEAAAGAYDVVVLARGYFIQVPGFDGSEPADVAAAVKELDEVALLVA